MVERWFTCVHSWFIIYIQYKSYNCPLLNHSYLTQLKREVVREQDLSCTTMANEKRRLNLTKNIDNSDLVVPEQPEFPLSLPRPRSSGRITLFYLQI